MQKQVSLFNTFLENNELHIRIMARRVRGEAVANWLMVYTSYRVKTNVFDGMCYGLMGKSSHIITW